MNNEYFTYTFIEGDPTVNDIQHKEEFYGLDKTKPLVYDYSYQKLYDEIINDKIIMRNSWFPFHRINKFNVIDSINLREQLGLKLREVNFLDESFTTINNTITFDEKFQKAINYGKVRNIPVEFSDGKDMNGGCQIFECEPTEEGEEKGIIIEKIEVPILNDTLSSCAYGHEIAHTQLLNINQATNNLLNTETIPIFIEQLFASIIDPTNRSLLRYRYFRLCDIVNKLSVFDKQKNLAYVSKIIYDMYIQSTLQAIKLFSTYSFSDENVKKEIIFYINKIFSGDILIEDMLNHFEANLDEVPKELKILKRIRK